MRRSWLQRIRQAEGLDISELVARTERRYRHWHIAGLLLLLVGMVLTTFLRGDAQVFGGALVLGGVVLLALLKINTQTTLSAIWVVNEVRKQKSEDAQQRPPRD